MDLVANIKVPFHVAVLGGTSKITKVDNTVLDVTIKSYTQSGQQLKLKGLGVAKVNSYNVGDLIVVVDIEVPKYRNIFTGLLGGSMTSRKNC